MEKKSDGRRFRPTRRQYIAIAGVAMTGSLAGCSEESDEFEGGNDSTDGGDGSSGDLELLDHEMVRDQGEFTTELYVEGQAENISGGELDYAEVEVKFKQGDAVEDSWLDNINGLSDGDVWNFQVDYLGTNTADITDYEIRAGTSL